MPETILILGGTKEAAALAKQLVEAKQAERVITSLAGRTNQPKPVAGEVRIGGFGGVGGLADYIRQENVTRLIDATHPFATQISINAKAAAAQTGVSFQRIVRPPWKARAGDNWTNVQSLDEARDALPTGARVLLAIGAQHMAVFAIRSDVTYIVRTVDGPATDPPLKTAQWLTGIPSTDWRDEMAILRNHAITHIVCRNSGGAAAYAKIEAARRINLPVIMVSRPVI